MSDEHGSGRILAIEPDPRIGALLHRVLDGQVRACLIVVLDVDAALQSIAAQIPDLILTSPFLPPTAFARLIDDLRRRDDATHVQVLATPHFPEPAAGEPAEDDPVRVLRFDRQRQPAVLMQRKDPGAGLRQQVDQYLELARALRAAARDRQAQGLAPVSSLVHVGRPRDPWERTIAPGALVAPTAKDIRAMTSALRPADRRGASRRRAADLAGQWGVRVNDAADASIVDISSSGVRLETSSRLNPGGLIDLEVIGLEGSVNVGARLIRSEVIDGSGDEVKYRAAAMFVREVDLFAVDGNPIMVAAAAAESCRPTALADLLGRVLANANWVSNGAPLRVAFENEVRALVQAREVRIRGAAAPAGAGCQSLYFHIPCGEGPREGLHIVFERGHRPTAAEFRLLRAAASLAAVVLELAPADE